MTLNESSLALQIQEGHATDPAIATLLVQQFAPGVQRLTLNLLNGHPDAPTTAREITRQTFVHALNDPESFMGKEDIRAWLYAQAMNLLKTVKPPIRKPQYLPVLLRYGHHLPLIEIAHLLRTSEAKIHKQLTEAREKLLQQVDKSASTQVNVWASQRFDESASQRINEAPINQSTNSPINHPPAPLPSSHFPRETQRLLDHILDPEAESNFREHLETCPDCHEHLLHFTQLETYLDTTLFYDTALPEEQVQDIVQAVLQHKHPVKKSWQMPPVLTRLPYREMGWVFSAAVAFLFLARWLNPYFSSPPPPRTPTPAPTATLPPAQALSTVFRQTDPSLISATSPGQHILWSLTDIHSGTQIPGTSVAFSRHLYAAFGQENYVIFCHLESFAQFPLEGHTAPVTALAFFPQEILLASGDESGTILLWDLVDQRIRFRLENQPGAIHQLAISQDGRYLAVALDEGVWVWEIKAHTVQLIQKYRWQGIRLATFSPDGQYLAAADQKNTIIVWSFPAGKFLLRYETLENGDPDQLTQLVYAPDSKTLATGSMNGQVEIVTLTPNADSLQGTRLFTLSHPPSLTDVQWSPDGKTLAVVSDSGSAGDQDSSGRAIYLWDTETGMLITAPLTARAAWGLSELKFSPVDGSISATNILGDLFQWTFEDVSHLVAAVPEPNLFTRTASNLLEGPLPTDTLPLQFTEVTSTTFSFIPFTLSPLLQTYSNRYTLTGGQHSVEDGVIALNYHISSGETLILTQRALTDSEIPAVGRAIGASAVVQPVQIHGTVGEYVVGSWTLTYPDNPDGTDENALYRWQPTGEARLRWIQAGLLMEIRVPQFQFQHGNLTMDELVILAENLVAQTETPILYTYTIEDGDTCVGIAQRYGVTPNRIAEVNGMENCDLIVAGQPLLVPLPTARTTVAEADLNCDGKLERVRAIPDPLLGDLSANFGVVVEAIPAGGDQYWPIWQETIADVTAVFFGLPQIFEGSACESFLGISIFAGEGQHSGLDLYRWDGTALQMVLDANGFAKEFTPPGTTPFQITTQSLVRDVAAGGCTRTTTTYEWDGTAFAPVEEIREEGVACLDG